MINIEVKPRQDDLYDIYVSDAGDHFLNSNQGYENVEDAERIARRLWPPFPDVAALKVARAVNLEAFGEPVILRVTYRNGKTKTEQLR